MLLLFSVLLGALGSEEMASGAAQQLQALHCPPCERIHCSSRRALKLQCKGGVTTGVCGCCPVCARTEGESCGGTWDYLGKCDEGLVCAHQGAAADKPDEERQGICKAGEMITYEPSIKQENALIGNCSLGLCLWRKMHARAPANTPPV
uniref:Si:ch73-330k17.3 n=1 Tax=Echeneis naucrates TaxID=173247 RepID=A0A665WYF9_ECHNA